MRFIALMTVNRPVEFNETPTGKVKLTPVDLSKR